MWPGLWVGEVLDLEAWASSGVYQPLATSPSMALDRRSACLRPSAAVVTAKATARRHVLIQAKTTAVWSGSEP
jgi:hypothetical protein